MKWQDFVDVIERLPTTPDYFNSIISIIYAQLKVAQNNKGEKSIQTFREQLLALKLPEDQAGQTTTHTLQHQWYKLFVLLAKQTAFTRSGNFYENLRKGMQSASKKITHDLHQWRRKYQLEQDDDNLLSNIIRGIERVQPDFATTWVTKQKILYLLLMINRRVIESGKQKWAHHLPTLGRLIDTSLVTDFKMSLEEAKLPGAQIGRLQVNVAPFYAELSSLLLATDAEGPFALLRGIQSITHNNLFNHHNPVDVYKCQIIDMKTRWLMDLKKFTLPWMWQHYNKGDEAALRALNKLLQGYDRGGYVHDLPRSTWIKQIGEYKNNLGGVLWPPLRNLLIKQVDECVRDVLVQDVAITFDELTSVLANLPLKAKSEGLLLSQLVKRFAAADPASRLSMLTLLIDREIESGNINYHIKALFEEMLQRECPADLKPFMLAELERRNAHIESRQTGFLGWFRRGERSQLLVSAKLQAFVQHVLTPKKYIANEDIDRQFAPFLDTVSDADYRQQTREKFQANDAELSVIEKNKIQTFNKIIRICDGDPKYIEAVKLTVPAAVRPQVSELLTEASVVALPNSGVLLRQSVNALKVAIDDGRSAIAQTFTAQDIKKLQKIIQHFDDLEIIEEEKVAIRDDEDLELFSTTLQRRLAGMWLTAHVVSTNDVSMQANAGSRALATGALIGGGLVSLPVISGVLTGMGRALEVADQFRKYDNYIRLQDMVPSGTTAEMFAEMVTRIITLRYAQQIHHLERAGIEHFAEYCYQKIRGGLLSQRALRVPKAYDQLAFSPDDALCNQPAYLHAYGVAEIASRPLDPKYIAKDSQVTLDLFKRLKIKSRFHYGRRVWNTESMLLEPDLVFKDQLYRSPHAQLKGNRRSEYGSRLADAHEVARLQHLGPHDEAESTDQLKGLPPSVQRYLVNLEARSTFAYQRSLQASAAIKQLRQGPAGQQQRLPPAGQFTSPSRIQPQAPDLIKAAVDMVIPDTPMKAIPAINRELKARHESYQLMQAGLAAPQATGIPTGALSPPRQRHPASPEVDNPHTPPRSSGLRRTQSFTDVRTPQQQRILGQHADDIRAAGAGANELLAPALMFTPLRAPVLPLGSPPRTPFNAGTPLRRYAGTQVVAAGPDARYTWPTETELRQDITRLMATYKQLRTVDEENKIPEPSDARIQCRSQLLEKMYSFCLLQTHYDVDQAIFMFNHWCGYKGEVFTPHVMLRQRVEAEVRANDRVNDTLPVNANLQQPYAIPPSPMVKIR